MKSYIILGLCALLLQGCAIIKIADTAVNIVTAPVDLILGMDEGVDAHAHVLDATRELE